MISKASQEAATGPTCISAAGDCHLVHAIAVNLNPRLILCSVVNETIIFQCFCYMLYFNYMAAASTGILQQTAFRRQYAVARYCEHQHFIDVPSILLSTKLPSVLCKKAHIQDLTDIPLYQICIY